MIFNADRLVIARSRRLLTKKKLADLAGLSSVSITRFERGTHVPEMDSIRALAKALEFPVNFFGREEIEIPSAETTSFRSQKSMTAGVRDAALAAGSIAFDLADWFDNEFEFREADLPDFSGSDDKTPTLAARALRELWGLGEAPISNMIKLLESKGIRVFSLAENTTKVNAYTLWIKGKPYIFLNTMMSAERSRFDAAHELGHLVLHQDGKVTGREAEDQANAFASEFLMPKADVVAHYRKVYSIDDIVRVKKRWKVSVAALLYRYNKLGFFSEWNHRDLVIQLARRGYKTKEPNSIEHEVSLAWSKALQILWNEGIRVDDIAKKIDIPISEIESLLFISNRRNSISSNGNLYSLPR